jgi:hypothetical protein
LVENIDPIKRVWEQLEDYKDRQIPTGQKGENNNKIFSEKGVKDEYSEIDFRSDFKVYVLDTQIKKLKRSLRDKTLLTQLEYLLDKVNDLYRYSLSKERIMEETRQNEWVQTINREEDKYMTIEDARKKLDKIKSYQFYNDLIRRLKKEKNQENNE